MSATKNQVEKAHASALIKSLFQTFQLVFNRHELPRPEDFLKVITPNFRFTSNGASCKNLYEYVMRLAAIKNNFIQVEIKNTQLLLVAEDKAVVNYLIILTPKKGEKKEVHVMAVATIENEHFTEWNQVTHMKGSNTWD